MKTRKVLSVLLALVMALNVIVCFGINGFAGDDVQTLTPSIQLISESGLEDDGETPVIRGESIYSQGNYNPDSKIMIKTSGSYTGDYIYSRVGNTLYLFDVNACYAELVVNGVGDGFKICVIGNVYLGRIVINSYGHGADLTVFGDGKLTVNRELDYDNAIVINAENEPAFVKIDDEYIEVDLYSKEDAIVINGSCIENAEDAVIISEGVIKETETVAVSGEYAETTVGYYNAGQEFQDDVGMTENNPGRYYGIKIGYTGLYDSYSQFASPVQSWDFIREYAYDEVHGLFLPIQRAYSVMTADEYKQLGFCSYSATLEGKDFYPLENAIICKDTEENKHALVRLYDSDNCCYYNKVFDVKNTDFFDGKCLFAENTEISADELTPCVQSATSYTHKLKSTHFRYSYMTAYPDVSAGDWFFEAVKYVTKSGYMSGYKNGKFGPADSIQRQDFVLILARIAKIDLSEYEGRISALKDIDNSAYYASAVAWAVETGLVKGYDNGCFGVGDPITREQICTILYRQARKHLEPDYMPPPDALDGFTDKDTVSPFAREGMAYLVNFGIIKGKTDTLLAPTGTASRAEVATIAMRAKMYQTLPPGYGW